MVCSFTFHVSSLGPSATRHTHKLLCTGVSALFLCWGVPTLRFAHAHSAGCQTTPQLNHIVSQDFPAMLLCWRAACRDSWLRTVMARAF